MDDKKPSILTSFLIYDTMRENRLRLTPAYRKRPEGRFFSRSSATEFCEATRNVWKCKVPESQGAQTPPPPKKNKTYTNKKIQFLPYGRSIGSWTCLTHKTYIRIQHQWPLVILNQFSVLIYAVCHMMRCTSMGVWGSMIY
jgi:hypothetical protein